jgi:hypothetical protein
MKKREIMSEACVGASRAILMTTYSRRFSTWEYIQNIVPCSSSLTTIRPRRVVTGSHGAPLPAPPHTTVTQHVG